MQKIQMVDLTGQYDKIKPEINKAIQNVLDTATFIKGNEVISFEKELADFTGAKHVIACANGTDALQIAMMALGLEPGDEVITPNFTYIATAEVIALLKLTPVFVDVDPDSFNIDLNSLQKAITSKTKAIVPVHLYGQCAEMEKLLEIARKNNLYVIEDTAQALGAVYTFSDGTQKQAGTMGTIGTTSFFPSKNLGCYGDGGAIFVNDSTLAKKIQMIANHGQSEKYIHDVIGVNSRLDTIQAAILRVKLRYLANYTASRNEVASYYDNAFSKYAEISIPKRSDYSSHVFHQYTIKLNGIDRDVFKSYLQEKGIPAMIYYPLPLHKQKAFIPYINKNSLFPVSESLCTDVISLPIHTEMKEEQLEYISNQIIQYLTNK